MQNFIPGALSVPHELQVAPAAISDVDFFFRSASCAEGWDSGVPHDWQNLEPSRLSLPQLEHSAMAFLCCWASRSSAPLASSLTRSRDPTSADWVYKGEDLSY